MNSRRHRRGGPIDGRKPLSNFVLLGCLLVTTTPVMSFGFYLAGRDTFTGSCLCQPTRSGSCSTARGRHTHLDSSFWNHHQQGHLLKMVLEEGDDNYLDENDDKDYTYNNDGDDYTSEDFEEDLSTSDFGEGDLESAGVVLEDLSWRVEKLRLEEANTRRFLKSKPRFLPYDECCKWVQAWGRRWTCKEDWVQWISDGEKRNAYIPSRPDEYYGGLGVWISWEHFLGVEEKTEDI